MDFLKKQVWSFVFFSQFSIDKEIVPKPQAKPRPIPKQSFGGNFISVTDCLIQRPFLAES